MRTLSPETNKRILDTASHLFSEERFDDVHMDDVAVAAGISKVTLYRYFKNKEDLYLKILEGVGREYLGLLREADRSVRGCRAKLVVVTRVALGYFAARPHLLKLLDRAGIDRDRNKVEFPWLEVQQEFFRMVKGLFAGGVATGEFLVEDLDLAVRALLGAMRFQHLYPSEEGDPETVPERIVGMLARPANRSPVAKAS